MKKSSIKKISKLISEMIILLEKDMSNLENRNMKKLIDISTILSRLTILITQLNKLSDSQDDLAVVALDNKDVSIIENFIEKHLSNKGQA